MFLKLTELDYNDNGDDLLEKRAIFFDSSSIIFMRRDTWHDKVDCTEIYIGTDSWPKVKETPEEIIEMIRWYPQIPQQITVLPGMRNAKDTDKP